MSILSNLFIQFIIIVLCIISQFFFTHVFLIYLYLFIFIIHIINSYYIHTDFSFIFINFINFIFC